MKQKFGLTRMRESDSAALARKKFIQPWLAFRIICETFSSTPLDLGTLTKIPRQDILSVNSLEDICLRPFEMVHCYMGDIFWHYEICEG